MKPVGDMSIGELAAFVCSHLKSRGIQTVLSGGACVSIYSANRYESLDLDFVEKVLSGRKKLRAALLEIGFTPEARYFKHPDTRFFLEFPPGPLCVGDEPVKQVIQLTFSTGELLLISPTDSVKDRLAGYYHWRDLQCLRQALLIAATREIDLEEVSRWSNHEGMLAEFKGLHAQFVEAAQGRVSARHNE
jgi:hypothetical protein